MAFEIDLQEDRGYCTAGENLTSGQYLAVQLIADALEVKASTLSAGDPVFGIVQNAPAQGTSATVRREGVSFCVAGTGDISIGDLLATDGDGKLVTAGADDVVVGFCVAAAADGNIGSVDLGYSGAVAGA